MKLTVSFPSASLIKWGKTVQCFSHCQPIQSKGRPPGVLGLPSNGLQYSGKDEISIHETNWGQHWEHLKVMLVVAGLDCPGLETRRNENRSAPSQPASPPGSVVERWTHLESSVGMRRGSLYTVYPKKFLYETRSRLLLRKMWFADW